LRVLGGLTLLAFLASPSRYQLELAVVERDYFLPSPAAGQRIMVLRLDLRHAPPKSRILFNSPLAAGDYRLRVEVTGDAAGRTMVIAVPLTVGASSFDVSIAGTGRFDLGFWADGPGAGNREYRFTVVAPVRGRTFRLDMPPR
jgi:hypothetical protein